MLKGLQIEKTMCSEYYLVDKLVFVRLKHKIVVNFKKKKKEDIFCVLILYSPAAYLIIVCFLLTVVILISL